MKNFNFIFKALLFSSLTFLTSCSDDDNSNESNGDYKNGLLISGEGSGAGSGSVSFISEDYTTSESKIYNKVNSSDLGTFLQSITFDGDIAYIVVDNQNTVTVVDRYSFLEIGKITSELVTPRYMAIEGNRGYITNWGDPFDATDDFIAVVNVDTFEFIEKIAVANGPEKIIIENGNLYISHKGAFSTNNIISIINIGTSEVTTITVNDNPDEMHINSNNELIVLSEGRILYDEDFNVIGNTLAAISTIDLNTNSVDSVLEFEDAIHPSLMVVNNDTIYYSLGNDVYSIATNATMISSTALFSGADSFLYGLAINGSTIYTLDSSFSDISQLNIFDINTNEKKETLEAPLGASKIYFN